MLISRHAGRGERASPVLFLHSSDERGTERGMEKRETERGEAGNVCVAAVAGREWRGKRGKDEGQRRKSLEGECGNTFMKSPAFDK